MATQKEPGLSIFISPGGATLCARDFVLKFLPCFFLSLPFCISRKPMLWNFPNARLKGSRTSIQATSLSPKTLTTSS